MENNLTIRMKRISIDHPDAINAALSALKQNKIIAYPTDTIYGIGTDIDNDLGIKKINHLKKRKAPMSIITHNFDNIVNKIIVSSHLRDKMDAIINNGDTCIVEYKARSFNSLIAKDNRIGFRIPNYPFLVTLLSKYKKPITTTSINTTGQQPLNDPDKIEELFGGSIDLLLDAGPIKNKGASKIYILGKDNISQIR